LNNKTLLKTGVVGTVVAALCCFTPILVILLTGVGLAAAIGYLDVVLFPALAIFVFITLYALWRRHRHPDVTSN
jgi:mercuric ion transport protein